MEKSPLKYPLVHDMASLDPSLMYVEPEACLTKMKTLITSKDKCNILDIDQSPGGTAEDYELHITNTIDRIADVYCAELHKYDYRCTMIASANCKCKVISNIKNTTTDRAAVNHATISGLEQASQWRTRRGAMPYVWLVILYAD